MGSVPLRSDGELDRPRATGARTSRLRARCDTLSCPDLLLLASHDSAGFSSGQLKVVRGRVANPGVVDEAVAGYALAERLGLRPGDTMTVSVTPPEGGGESAGTGKP